MIRRNQPCDKTPDLREHVKLFLNWKCKKFLDNTQQTDRHHKLLISKAHLSSFLLRRANKYASFNKTLTVYLYLYLYLQSNQSTNNFHHYSCTYFHFFYSCTFCQFYSMMILPTWQKDDWLAQLSDQIHFRSPHQPSHLQKSKIK